MARKRLKPETPPEWLDLTFVRLGNTLARKMGGGDGQSADAFTRINMLTGRFSEWVSSRFLDRSFEKAAARRIGELEVARQRAADSFAKAVPDCRGHFGPDSTAGYGCTPADPVLVLRTFCNVVIRVHTSLPQADMSDVVLASFRCVALPQLHAHLARIEAKVHPSLWPELKGNDGNELFAGRSRTPSDLARMVVDGLLARRHFDASSPKLRHPVVDTNAIKREKDKDLEAQRLLALQSSEFLWLLLRKAARSDSTWENARRLAEEYLSIDEESGQQVGTGLGRAQLDFNTMNLAERCDRAHQTALASFGGGMCSRAGKSFPQYRREILFYASQTENPSEAEIRSNFAGSIDLLKDRLPTLPASACLAYAYHFSKKTTLRLKPDGKLEDDPLKLRASKLTCDLLRSAAGSDDRDIRSIALRYLAGYVTNPRYICGSDDFVECPEWISMYEKEQPGSLLVKHFRARHLLALRKHEAAAVNYRVLFVRAMPSGELKADPKGPLGIMLASSQSQQLTDMECISYLLPECYALAGRLLDGKLRPSDPESDMQRDIRRISEAHFGVSCNNWREEESRIIAGFELRAKLT
jgi:hypothetical protein